MKVIFNEINEIEINKRERILPRGTSESSLRKPDEELLIRTGS